jgi:hypothetical protein
MFGTFIRLRHDNLMEIWNVWHGSYLSAGVIKAIGSGLHTYRSDAHTVGAEGDFAARTDAFAGSESHFCRRSL